MKTIFSKSFQGMKIAYVLPFLCIGAIGLIFGSIFDLNLSNAIATKGTPFGMLFETWGSFFLTLLAPIGTGIMGNGMIRKGNKPIAIIIGIILSVGALAMGIYYGFHSIADGVHRSQYGYTLPLPAAIVVASIIDLGLYSIGFFFADKEQSPYRLAIIGLAIFGTYLAVQGVFNIFKMLAARPRYRFLAWEDNAYSVADFRAWWEFSLLHKLNDGGYGDVLKSFPSGHTGGTVAYICIPVIFSAFKKTKDNELVHWIGVSAVLLLSIVVAFARIVNGAHFLSDTAFGMIMAALTALALYVLVDLLLRKVPNIDFARKENHAA